jgi:hypothetical protein
MRMLACALIVLILAPGCGPMMFPMVRPLAPDEQKQIDSAWNAMLTPVKRTDRQTLLDCIILMQMYQLGVDRFTARSTKTTSAGRVEMSIDFDRAKPERDQFVFRVAGPWGQTLRQEKWSSAEVFQAGTELTETHIENAPNPDLAAHKAEAEKRIQRATAATQPAIN